MAPPATKRRKLSHSRSASHDVDSDYEGDDVNTNGADESDTSTNAREHTGDELISGSEDDDMSLDEVEGNSLHNEKKDPKAHTTAQQNKKAQSRRDNPLQDGVHTAEVYKSNVFKLQVDELLKQVQPNYGKTEAPAEHSMRTLKAMIEQMPRREPMPVSQAEAALKSEGVVIPFPTPAPPKDALYKLQYDRPHSINATGSYALKLVTRTSDEFAIDLVVTMPKSLFQDKDYLNHRYFYRRAYYLACIAAGIKNSQEHRFKVSFDYLGGNHLQPILVVSPNGQGDEDDFSSSKCHIHILLALPEKTFTEGKLLPSSNCIRPKSAEDGSDPVTAFPTPFYNGTIQSDASITAYLKLLHSASSKCDGFRDACILGRVWLNQRTFASRLRLGGFGNFEWSAMVALLLQPNTGSGAPLLSPGYSSYQLFKAVLQFIASRDLSKTPFIFQARNVTFPKVDSTPVLFDGPRNLNLLFKMTPWSYARLQAEARNTIEMLGDSLFDQFESTFILKTDSLKYRYDAALELPLSAFGLNSSSETYDQGLDEAIRNLYSTLTRALTDRVSNVSLLLPSEGTWPVSKSRPPEDQAKAIVVSIATNPANANRTVDHGPAAENKKEAASFRQFWGEKAELRRFKDGSILESVVWSLKDNSMPIIEQIVRFIVKKHLGATVAAKIAFSSDSFAHMISAGRLQSSSGTSPFQSYMTALTTIESDIRGLDGLPLSIRHITAADPQLRYSAVECPSATRASPTQGPASLVLQFEGSARWPDDLCAIQRTKVAFLLKLSELLTAAKPTYITRVGLENPSQPSQNQAYLDVLLPSALGFRLRIHHDREATLLERQLKDKSLDGQSRESAASALATYKRDFIQIPAHTQVMQSMCTRFSALSPSIRLTKRWFSSHLLSPHFSTEFIELLVVRTFLQPYPWPIPPCATTGFLRTLSWISRWDWRHAPLIVDFSSSNASIHSADIDGAPSHSLKHEDVDKIQTRFEAWRRIDPAMNRVVLFAATNLDLEGNTWTDRGKPEKVVASRMTALAKAATALFKDEEDRIVARVNGKQLSTKEGGEFAPETLFASPLQDFDFTIHISSKYSHPTKKKSEPKYKNLEMQQGPVDAEAVGYAPAQLFAEELQQVYGGAVLWFWNPEVLDVIAGLWNPLFTGQRSFKVKPGWSSVPVSVEAGGKKKKGKKDEDAEVEIRLNQGAILNEIRRLGGELIERIEMKD